MSIEAFRVAVSEETLQDLQLRLKQSRWVEDFGNEDWRYGSNGAYLKELLDYWRDRYDWRAQEREINGFAQFRTEIDGIPIHFIHVRSKHVGALPSAIEAAIARRHERRVRASSHTPKSFRPRSDSSSLPRSRLPFPLFPGDPSRPGS